METKTSSKDIYGDSKIDSEPRRVVWKDSKPQHRKIEMKDEFISDSNEAHLFRKA
jgi:hypothetical protein